MAEQKELEEAPAKVSLKILSEQEYEGLAKLYASRNKDNKSLADAIMVQLDHEANIMYIWKLARKYNYDLMNRRIKKHREFIADLDLYSLIGKDDKCFADYLIKRGWMTHERFMILKHSIINNIIKVTNLKHSFYELKLSYELKPEYKHLDPTDKQQTV